MLYIAGWIFLSTLAGIVGFLKEGYFLGPFMLALLGSPVMGFIYVFRIGFDEEDNLLG